MRIRYYPDGNIVEDDAELLVCTVNVFGPMGKGVADDFHKKWKSIKEPYKQACLSKDLIPGGCLLFPLPDGRRWAAMATKDHWTDRSRMEWIASGLVELARLAGEAGVRSIAIPKPGCGNGGLDWAEVEPMVVAALGHLDLRIYGEPMGPVASREVLRGPKQGSLF